MATSTPRRQRRDAARNRQQVLDAATAAFAERGLTVDMREIARSAGVGIGTLYRHFPTKDDLVRATVEDDLTDWASSAEQAVSTEDAWEGLCAFVEQTVSTMAKQRALLDGFSGSEKAIEDCREHLHHALDGLVTRAHKQGALRADATAADVGLQILALGRIIQLTADTDPEAWRKHVGFALDGLRRGGATGD